MATGKREIPRLHEDRDLFRAALTYTAAETTFQERLIEKDYYCTLLLSVLNSLSRLVFKGGTCLAKVYANFYRLSEDLDFVFPMPNLSAKKDRRERIKPAKEFLSNLHKEIPTFRVAKPLTGANDSRQYLGAVEYDSVVSGGVETIKIEIGLREPLIDPPKKKEALTILRNPAAGGAMVPPLSVQVISMREAYAEKFRAAFTRREVAIRDFFDIDFAVRHLDLDTKAPQLISLIKKKLAVSSNESVNIGDSRLEELRSQLQAQLLPVLRKKDLEEFDLDRAFGIVSAMAKKLNT